ncbi:glycerophosphodiester phosphodiesterase, partial [Halobium palmae]
DTPVWELDYAALRGFDVLDTGESVPRLAEVLDAVPPRVDVNVELKHPGRGIVECGPLDADVLADQRAVWRDFVGDVVDVLDGYAHDVLFSSFHEGALAAARDVDASIPLANVFFESVASGLAVARRHDVEYFHVPLNMVLGTSRFGEPYAEGPYEPVDLLSIAREEGRRVNVWTVRDPRDGVELARAGVDGLITDLPVTVPEAGAEGSAPAVDGAD